MIHVRPGTLWLQANHLRRHIRAFVHYCSHSPLRRYQKLVDYHICRFYGDGVHYWRVFEGACSIVARRAEVGCGKGFELGSGPRCVHPRRTQRHPLRSQTLFRTLLIYYSAHGCDVGDVVLIDKYGACRILSITVSRCGTPTPLSLIPPSSLDRTPGPIQPFCALR